MAVIDLLNHLGIESKLEGSQLVVDCHLCGKPKHLYVDGATGLYHCKVCGGSGNPYQLIKHYQPGATPKEIFDLLKQFNLADGTTEKQPTKRKDLSWLRDKLRKANDEDIERLCKAKGVSEHALRQFDPDRPDYVSTQLQAGREECLRFPSRTSGWQANHTHEW